jgi:hypothetical protein
VDLLVVLLGDHDAFFGDLDLSVGVCGGYMNIPIITNTTHIHIQINIHIHIQINIHIHIQTHTYITDLLAMKCPSSSKERAWKSTTLVGFMLHTGPSVDSTRLL